jgi:predicted CoA-binding protein
MSKPTVAILGASADRSKFGNKSVRAHAQAGYEVFPVNPKGGTIEGLTVYQTLAEVPADHLNRISVYLPPSLGLGMLKAMAAADCDEIWFNPGSESPQIMATAAELGVRVVTACSIVDLGLSPSQFP